MNYYEHHIGDYATATKHLTWDEDMAYTRLIRLYYEKEQPIPADLKKACRLVCATSKLQREAVETVLEEFFELREDGWHQQVCDENLSRYLEGEPEREVKKANEENRLKRHRAERAQLFKTLTDAGEHAPWNIGMAELRKLVGTLQNGNGNAPETQPETAPETPATATQEPVPSTQSPLPIDKTSGTASAVGITPRDGAVTGPMLSAAMRKHGVLAQGSDPRVVKAASHGITPETVDAACQEAKAAKPDERISAAYVLAIAERWTAEAGKPRANGNGRRTIHDERADAYAILTGKTRHDTDDRTIDVAATPIG